MLVAAYAVSWGVGKACKKFNVQKRKTVVDLVSSMEGLTDNEKAVGKEALDMFEEKNFDELPIKLVYRVRYLITTLKKDSEVKFDFSVVSNTFTEVLKDAGKFIEYKELLTLPSLRSLLRSLGVSTSMDAIVWKHPRFDFFD